MLNVDVEVCDDSLEGVDESLCSMSVTSRNTSVCSSTISNKEPNIDEVMHIPNLRTHVSDIDKQDMELGLVSMEIIHSITPCSTKNVRHIPGWLPFKSMLF